MIGIYAIRNKVNGKVYIGQSRRIQKRLKQHLDALERGRHHSKKLQKDFDELGVDKFSFEVIELCTSDQLDQKEMEWITKFDALRNGYNTQDPQTRKSWFFFKREKRPGLTVRGELSRIFREVAFSLIHDFEDWIKAKRHAIGIIAKGMSVGFLVAFILWSIDFIYDTFGGGKTFLYCIFLLVSGFAVGAFYESYKEKLRR